ncbi:MAG: IgGFc-binding protein [Polyangiaceae bacterium]
MMSSSSSSRPVRWAPCAFVVALAVACSASNDPGDPTGSGAGGPGPGSGAASGTGGGIDPSGGAGGGVPGVGCSADLQKVVDEDGAILAECPPDQGCFGGQCIPACDAASQSRGSIGCDFYAPDPPFLSNGMSSQLDGPCYAVFLANTWKRPAKIEVSRGGQTLDVSSFGRIPKGLGASVTYEPIPATGLPPDEVAVLFLSHKPGVVNFTSLECPVAPAQLVDAAVSGTGRGSAFHVSMDTPVSSYDILPYGGATSYLPSASLLFPASAWGTNYVAVTTAGGGSGSLWALVVASEDATTVSVVPATTALPAGNGVAAAPLNQTTTYTLNAGETLQWLDPTFGGPMDPTGTVIGSDKPVGLFAGNTYLGVGSATSGPGGQDSAHQQIPHVKALGNEYVGAGVVTRLASLQPESVPYRLLGVVDGTTLTYDPVIPGAPTTLSLGQVVQFETTLPFSVRSQDADHPFAFTQYLPGTNPETRPGCGPAPPLGGITCGLGDEEWVSLVPPEQFLQRYVFFTDPTYATTNLVLVRRKGASSFAEVDIACLGAVSGWQPVGSAGVFEVAHIDLVRGGVPVGNCGTSRHEASSNGAFGVVVWGTDFYSSYGYPAGGNVGSINDVIVEPVPK